SLDHDPDPFFNPTTAQNDGMHQRIIPWVSWHYRVTGWAYYDFGRFFNGHLPSIRAELFREGFEDYEYLVLANGGVKPSVGNTAAVDETVDSVTSSLTSFTKNADALMTLRRELGFYIEGSRSTLPRLEIESDIRPRGEYHISFQDPLGPPAADPLIIGDATFIKAGWNAYDEALGYGWYGEYIGNDGIMLYGYDDAGDYNEAQKSYIYDDYGRGNLFEFAIGNGTYLITLSVGRPARAYGGDPHNAIVEGVVFVDDEPTTDEERVITRTMEVTVSDGYLSLEVGGRSESTGEFAYTFLSTMSIVPVE
ncbi:DUF4091 domain-containing protein, partial [Myxococcota bacterium]|nr:DUF4091 domain-containing protein [Myxococcota bacterium]